MTTCTVAKRMRIIALIGLAALLAAVGCASDTAHWSPKAAPKANRLALVNLTHDIRFEPSLARIGEGARVSLDAFLDRQDIGYGDRVYVVAAAETPAPIDLRRAEAVELHLLRRGIEPTVLPTAEWAGRPAGEATRLLVHRFLVRPPDCPDWRKPASGDGGNTEASNWGCATAVNFGLMVADPRDIKSGRAPGPMDGERAAAAVKRYRDGKVEKLQDTGLSE